MSKPTANVKVIASELGFMDVSLRQPGDVFYVTEEVADAGHNWFARVDAAPSEELHIAKVKEMLDARGVKYAANLGEKKLRQLLAETAASANTTEEEAELA